MVEKLQEIMADSSATPEEKFNSCTSYGETFISLLFLIMQIIDVIATNPL